MSEAAAVEGERKTKKKRPYYLCRVEQDGKLIREESVKDTKDGLKKVKEMAKKGDMGPFVIISMATEILEPRTETVVKF